MPTDDHPILKRMKDHASMHSAGRDQVYERASVEMALLSPEQRLGYLEHVSGLIAADEGSLRERSQLVALRRHLQDTDEKLRLAGR